MNLEITQEQQKQLDSWAAKRDSILSEIAVVEDINNHLNSTNKELAQSNSTLIEEINQVKGRIEELKIKEGERASLLPIEIASLEAKKTVLETTITALEGDTKELEIKKSSLLHDVANITGFHDHVFEKVNNLEGIITKTISISSENAKEIENILIMAGNELKKVIEVGEINVEKTNKVIEEIPKMIVDIHRGVIERRNISKIKK